MIILKASLVATLVVIAIAIYGSALFILPPYIAAYFGWYESLATLFVLGIMALLGVWYSVFRAVYFEHKKKAG